LAVGTGIGELAAAMLSIVVRGGIAKEIQASSGNRSSVSFSCRFPELSLSRSINSRGQKLEEDGIKQERIGEIVSKAPRPRLLRGK
jgi:hypothetical protein